MRSSARPQPPIQRLPVELLSYIFVLGTHSPPSHPASLETPQEAPLFDVDSVKTPLVFTAVNRHWRTVALNTPALWTSLCITVGSLESTADTEASSSLVLNTSHVTSYLSLSRNYPLDILIDARDMDWDFCEPEIPNLCDSLDYTPPFSSQTMLAVISLLLPHLPRWRSIDILTDTWAPMYVALNTLNESLTTRGALLLESLTLMRCNDFISHSSHFQPRHMRHPLFLKPRVTSVVCSLIPRLPRLRNLTLRGVHVCWSSLPSLLRTGSSSSLSSLELSSHCLDVRPSLAEFRTILSSCPMLRKLAVNGSGFALDQAKSKVGPSDGTPSTECEGTIPLSHLQELSLGYRSTLDGRKILALFSAPNVRKLTLEDASHPGGLHEADTKSILRYIATGDVGDARQRSYSRDVAVLFPDGLHQNEGAHSCKGPTSSSRSDCVVNMNHQLQTTATQQPFPMVDTVTLKGVKIDADSLNTFLAALVNLRFLVLNNVPFPMNLFHGTLPIAPHRTPLVDSIRPRILEPTANSFLPSSFAISPMFTNPFNRPVLSSGSKLSPPPLSCPKLEELCIRNSHISPSDLKFFVQSLVSERERGGWLNLYRVEIQLDSASETTLADIWSYLNAESSRRRLDSPMVLDRYPSAVEGNFAILKVPVKASTGITADEIVVKIVQTRPLNLCSEEEGDYGASDPRDDESDGCIDWVELSDPVSES
ncbi:hypothetical protein E1B28_005824 [Marasmius oreades]|uniref:F-box domain-containing protein n=1 Tax=Marasmius oreades TaxID=181124 RepID=A0A9P7S4H2_9AGAR|nr:uncharacterized protein E1B28_005824 [Marasmius oreades]KAG7095033.1 hypothetical protein E1B28_005824 [Marasmius oreades]